MEDALLYIVLMDWQTGGALQKAMGGKYVSLERAAIYIIEHKWDMNVK